MLCPLLYHFLYEMVVLSTNDDLAWLCGEAQPERTEARNGNWDDRKLGLIMVLSA